LIDKTSLYSEEYRVTFNPFIPVVRTKLMDPPSGVNLRQVRIGLEHEDEEDRAVS
jgi:hypothetical protein